MGEKEKNYWTVCLHCEGSGKKSRRITKKVRLQYERDLEKFKKSASAINEPAKPKAHLEPCSYCTGSGLIETAEIPKPNSEKYPRIAIIGGGIGGVALAVACLHRSIPFTLFERDANFDIRSQGYGLTLQQASKAIAGLGISFLKDGVISTKHVVHNIEGKILGEWGTRKWTNPEEISPSKRSNIHISRQSLRSELITQLGGNEKINWGYQLVNLVEKQENGIELTFKVNETFKTVNADIVVGADGIRSTVRNILFGNENLPLRYLNCIVILGICPLDRVSTLDSELLDSATVFQTANGNERIYMMPYSNDTIMWQLSFPMEEDSATELSKKGAKALKKEAMLRTQWHTPIPEIIKATLETQISGYPVYDRPLLEQNMLQRNKHVTLIGDAAHPMSPFKGQGANQALLDALSLARKIVKGYRSSSKFEEKDSRECVLNDFETEMLTRSAVKVKDSAAAAVFLHSESVLHESDAPRRKRSTK